MTNNTTITTFRPSENAMLSSSLMNLEEQLEAAARQNLETILAQQDLQLSAFTDSEVLALVTTEKLRLVNGMDLATILLRGKLLKQIEDQALFTIHPNGYPTLEALAEEQGISLSELSDIRTMTQIVFPYIEDTLSIPIAQIWETIGKSKFRMLVPVLKALITGEEPDRGSARENYNRILDTTAIDLREAGQEFTEEDVRHRAISDLLVAGEQMRTRELQEHIRDGNPAPAITPTILVLPDGRRIMVSEVTDNQMQVVRRKLGRYMADPATIDLPQDARARQREALRIPILREITRMVEG